MIQEFTTSPLLWLVNYMLLGLMVYCGAVGVLLSVVPEYTKAHSWIERVLLPSAIGIVAFIVASGILFGGVVALLIAQSLS